jgi:glycerol uptake facilitator-like aquaporin
MRVAEAVGTFILIFFGSLGVASHDITAGDTIQRLISLSLDKRPFQP